MEDPRWKRVHEEYLKGADTSGWIPTPQDSVLLKILFALWNMLEDRLGQIAEANLRQWFVQAGVTSAAYEWIRSKEPRKLWHKFIWKSFIPPKFSFNLWLAIQGRLTTRDRLGFLETSQFAHYVMMLMNQLNTFSLIVRLHGPFGVASRLGLIYLWAYLQPWAPLNGANVLKVDPQFETKLGGSRLLPRRTSFRKPKTWSSLNKNHSFWGEVIDKIKVHVFQLSYAIFPHDTVLVVLAITLCCHRFAQQDADLRGINYFYWERSGGVALHHMIPLEI